MRQAPMLGGLMISDRWKHAFQQAFILLSASLSSDQGQSSFKARNPRPLQGAGSGGLSLSQLLDNLLPRVALRVNREEKAVRYADRNLVFVGDRKQAPIAFSCLLIIHR